MTVTSLSPVYFEQLREEGLAVVPGALTPDEVAAARRALADAVEQDRAAGQTLHLESTDPNDSNVRVFNLLGRAPIWEDLIDHPVTNAIAADFLGDGAYLISSLAANIALPGARSMHLHCDDSGSAPAPWLTPLSINVLVYLEDIDEENGATRMLPGSHRFTDGTMASQDDIARTVPIEAPAGSICAMDGRTWHTSGNNTSADRTRDVVLIRYMADHVRPQYDWPTLLSDDVKAALRPSVRHLLRLDTDYSTLDEQVVLWARDPYVRARMGAR